MPAPDPYAKYLSAPDPYARYLPQKPKPAAPQPKPVDYGNMPWSEVARNYVGNFGHDAMQSIIEPLKPKNWASDAEGVYNLGKGALSKAGNMMSSLTTGLGNSVNQPIQTTNPSDEATLNALAQQKKHSYGTVAGFKEMLSTHPVEPIMDALTFAAPLRGALGIASKLPVIGDSAANALRIARTASKAINPIGLPARALAKVLPKPTALTRAGEFTPAVQGAIKQAFPYLNPADLADPATKAAIQSVVSAKGLSPAAIKEAVLSRQGSPTPRSVVTGETYPSTVEGPVKSAIAQGKSGLADSAASVSGAPNPSSSSLGSALEQAFIDSHNAVTSQYAKAFSHEGQFTPKFAQTLMPSVSDALKTKNLPFDTEGFSRYAELYPKTASAFNWLDNEVPGMAYDDSLTLPGLERARQALVSIGQQATGSDARGVGIIKNALDKHIQKMAPTDFLDASGVPTNGTDLAADMATARKMYQAHQGKFFNTENPTHGAVTRAVKNLTDSQIKNDAGLITVPSGPGSVEAAHDILAKNIINPKTLQSPANAIKMRGKLTDVLGDDQPLNDYIRQSVTQGTLDKAGDTTLAASPNQVHSFLNGPLADVFSPDEQSNLKQIAESSRLLNTAPAQQNISPLKTAMGRLGRTAAAGTAGSVLGGEPGALMMGLAEQALEPMVANSQIKKALSGAPTAGSLVHSPARIAGAIADNPPEKVITIPYQGDQATKADQDQTDEVPQFASGGKVGHEHLVQRLMKLAEDAKRQTDAATKPLLQQSDNNIAHALAVAQKAI